MRPVRIAVCWLLFLSSFAVVRAEDDLFPHELVRFKPYAENPVFTAQGRGHWDVRIRERG